MSSFCRQTIQSIAVAFILLVQTMSYAQDPERYSKAMHHGDLYFNTYNYSKAINEYKIAAKINPKVSMSKLKIGECYQKSHDLKKAEDWYSKAILEAKDSIPPKFYYNYAVVLTKNNKHDEAKQWFEKYGSFVEQDSRYENYIHSIDNLAEFYTDSTLIVVRNLVAANSEHPDFGPHAIEDELLIVSTHSRYEDYKGDVYFDLFHAKIEDTTITDLMHFEEPLNSKYHEGPLTYDKNSHTLYFTRNIEVLDDLGEFQERKLGIYEFHYDGRKENTSKYVTKVEFMNFNHSAGHPALTRDGKTMYFIANTHFGKGGTDIYKSTKDHGVWKEPKLLELGINTEGAEMFPFIYQDSLLYFASDGHGGIGGLDIYKINLTQKKPQIINLGAPFNSHMDDFGIFFARDLQGYFTSNRAGGKGSDDIYHFELFKVPLKINILSDLAELLNLSSIVRVRDRDGNIHILDPSKKSEFEIDINPGVDYKVLVESEGNVMEFDIKLPKNTRQKEHVLNVLLKGQKDMLDSGFVRLNDKDTLGLVVSQEYKFSLIPIPNHSEEKDSTYFHTSLYDYTFHPMDTIVFSITNEVTEDYLEKDTLNEEPDFRQDFPSEFNISLQESNSVENERIRIYDEEGKLHYDSQNDHAYEFIPTPNNTYKVEITGDNIDTKGFELGFTEGKIKNNPELVIDLDYRESSSGMGKNEQILLDENTDSFSISVAASNTSTSEESTPENQFTVNINSDSTFAEEPMLIVYSDAGEIVYTSVSGDEFVPKPDTKYTFSVNSEDHKGANFDVSFSEERINTGEPFTLNLSGKPSYTTSVRKQLNDPFLHIVDMPMTQEYEEAFIARQKQEYVPTPVDVVMKKPEGSNPQLTIMDESGNIVFESNGNNEFEPSPDQTYSVKIFNEDESSTETFDISFSEEFLNSEPKLTVDLSAGPNANPLPNKTLVDPTNVISPYTPSDSNIDLASSGEGTKRDFELKNKEGKPSSENEIAAEGNGTIRDYSLENEDQEPETNGTADLELAAKGEGTKRDFELENNTDNEIQNLSNNEISVSSEGNIREEYLFGFDVTPDSLTNNIDTKVTDSYGNDLKETPEGSHQYKLIPDEEYLVQLLDPNSTDTTEFITSFDEQRLKDSPKLSIELSNTKANPTRTGSIMSNPDALVFNYHHIEDKGSEHIPFEDPDLSNFTVTIHPDSIKPFPTVEVFDAQGNKVATSTNNTLEYNFEPDSEYQFKISNADGSQVNAFTTTFSEDKINNDPQLSIDLSNNSADTLPSGSSLANPSNVAFNYHHIEDKGSEHIPFEDPDLSNFTVTIHPDSIKPFPTVEVFDAQGNKVATSTNNTLEYNFEPDSEYQFKISNADGSQVNAFTTTFSEDKINNDPQLSIDLSNNSADTLPSGSSLADPSKIAFNYHHIEDKGSEHIPFEDPDLSNFTVTIHPDSIKPFPTVEVFDAQGNKVATSTNNTLEYNFEPDSEYQFKISNADGSQVNAFTTTFSEDKINNDPQLSIDLSNNSADTLPSGSSLANPSKIAFNYHHIEDKGSEHIPFEDPDQSNLSMNSYDSNESLNTSKGSIPLDIITRQTTEDELQIEIFLASGEKVYSSTSGNDFKPLPNEYYNFKITSADQSEFTEFTTKFSEDKLKTDPTIELNVSHIVEHHEPQTLDDPHHIEVELEEATSTSETVAENTAKSEKNPAHSNSETSEPQSNSTAIPSLKEFTKGGITFIVQIAAATEPIPESYLKKIYGGDREIFTYEEEGWYKYGIAKTESYFEAKEILEASGVDGFIPAYNHNEKITVMQAMNDLYLRDLKPASDFKKPESAIVLNYEYDKFEVTEENLQIIKREVIPQTSENTKIIVSGHTDRQGSEAYNYSLSLYRANHVAKVLRETATDTQVKVEFYGETQLLEKCDMYTPCSDEVHQKNRRVEIYLYKTTL